MSATEHTTTTPATPVPVAHIELYEPAMCCPTGVCGPSVDEQLIAIREDLRWAEGQGAEVVRHNLSSDPDAFVADTKITGLMHALGDGALPALVANGEIVVHGRYPTREELGGIIGAATTSEPLTIVSSSGSSCGCAPGSGC